MGRVISAVPSLPSVRGIIGGDPLTVVELLYVLGRDLSLIGTLSPSTIVPVVVGVVPSFWVSSSR